MNHDINLKIFSFNLKVSINKQWVQFGIIVITILTGMIVSYWGSVGILKMLLVLLVGLAGILALFWQPNLGFILIFIAGSYMSYSLRYYELQFGGINIVVAIVALLLGIWFFDMLVVKREFRLNKSRLIFPVLVFFVISVLAFGMGQIPWYVFARQAPFPAQLGGFIIFTFSIGTLLLSAHFIRDLHWLKIIVWVFIGLGFFFVINKLFKTSLLYLFHSDFFGSMFWTWLVALSLGQAVFNSQLRPTIRGMLIGIVLITLYTALFNSYDWKSGWLPPLVSVAIILGIRFRGVPRFMIPLSLIFAIYILGILINSLIVSDDYSYFTRLEAWKIILEISRKSPILGTGFSNYYWYTPLYPILGWRVNFNSHSQYIDLIAQTGILGLICFFWIFFEIGRLSWALSRKLPIGFARAFSYSVFAGIIASVVAGYLGDWVLPFVYNVSLSGFRASLLPWLFSGCLVSIEQMLNRNNKLIEG